MSIAILGVNHKTASVAEREKLAFSPYKLEKALTNLSQHPLITGCVILSTCNRSELYLSFDHMLDLMHIQSVIRTWMYDFHGLSEGDVNDSLYWYVDELAVAHLMRVACGMDSQILGEPQILGQVKKAYALSQAYGTASMELTKLFQRGFYVAKRVRTSTQIGSNTASIAYAACCWARNFLQKSDTMTVLLIGAGETIELISRYLKQHIFKKIIIANRTRKNALKLAENINAEIISLSDISTKLKDADIVISSTASPLPIIDQSMVERSLEARCYQPMLFIDLAIPRDIESEVSNLAHVSLTTLDNLQEMVEGNLAKRASAAREAEYIIQEESRKFIIWLHSRMAVDFVKIYRLEAHRIKNELQKKALKSIQQGADIHDVIEQLSYQLTNRLIHAPTQSLLSAAMNDKDYLKILSNSLGLDKTVNRAGS